MPDNRWQQIEEVYHEALKRAPATRAAYLEEVCTGDEEMRRKVEALLAYDDASGDFIEQPALEMAAQAIAEEQTTLPLQLHPGQQLGAYQLQELLGRGGMGEVYLARDTRLHRKVAIKLLPARFTTDADRVRRFAQEARAASALNHPNILTIHEIGEVEGTHFIVTEYVAGETLRQRMTSAPHKQIQLTESLTITAQMAEALVAAHEAGIIHRDIKPENVMVRPDGYVKILDFGLAKLIEPNAPRVGVEVPPPTTSLTEAGVVMGTPRYMSPEQARGARVDARTDIFSLGVMLYEMATGRAPFAGTTPSEVIAAILRDAPAPLAHSAAAAPPELQHIVDRALQKDRAARYPAMPEMLADLKRLQRQLERQEEVPPPLSPLLSEVATMRLNTAVETAEPAAVTTAPQFSRLPKRHKLSEAIAIVLLLAAVAIAVYFSVRETAIDSLAVLPFVNVGANPDAEYLSDGVTDGLINSLAQLPKLKVMSRSAVFRYKGKEVDAQQAGNALGVRAVLTGKVTQRGDDLIVSAELVDVRDNSHLWGAQYPRKLSDLLAVQAELSRDIAGKLRLRLGSAEQQRLTKRGTENAEAYELYLKGRYYSNTQQREEEKKAIEYFQRAIEKDPGFAQPYAGLAIVYVAIASVGATYTIPPREAFQKAKEAASKAVELDDTLAEAHLSQAQIAYDFDWDWNAAEREFKRAIELNPNLVEAHHFYAHYLVRLGRFEEALAESLRALAADPLDVGMNYHLGWHYFHTSRYDQAVAQLQKTLGLNQRHSGAHGILGLSYGQQGRYPEAIAEIQKSNELGGRDIRGHLGYIYALAGRRGEAQKIIAQLREEAKHKPVSPFHIARIYAGLGEQEQALAWLDKAIAERDSNLNTPGLKVDVTFDSLRSDPRFADLLRRVGLPQ